MNLSNYISQGNMDSILKTLVDHKVSVLAATTAILYGIYHIKRPRNLPPGPLGYPYVGSLFELSGNVSKDFNRLAKKYGDLFCLWMGAERYVVVLNSYDVIKEAYITRGSDFADRKPAYSLGDFDVVEPLFNASYDEGHKFARKSTIKEFRRFLLTKMDDVLSEEMEKFDQTVQGVDGNPFRVSKHLEYVLANMFCALHWNETYPHGHPDLMKIVDGVSDWYEAFEDAFKDCFTGHTMLRPTAMSGMKKIKEFIEFVQQKINEHAETIDRANPRDMIDVLLKEDALNKFGMKHVCNMIIELLPNGVYTAAITIIWMLKQLENNPQYQDAMLKEIRNVKGSSPIRTGDKPNLPLVDAFIMETLRVSTPLQISMINKPSAATTLRGYNIPENASIVCNYANVHVDPKLFPEPYTFKPERFIKNGKIHNLEGFVPFGMGRRVCVGDNLMRGSLFIIFGTIVQRYKITSDSKHLEAVIANNLVAKMTDFTVQLERRD